MRLLERLAQLSETYAALDLARDEGSDTSDLAALIRQQRTQLDDEPGGIS